MDNKEKQRHVVSVSIGSSERDHSVETEILGIPFKVERIGTNGDMDKALRMIKDLDGKVDAIGLGGIDLYIYVGNRRYVIRDCKKLANAAKITPTYDGSVVKISMEKEIIKMLFKEGKYLSKKSNVLLVSSVDRYGMAETFYKCGCNVVFGDFLFVLNIPLPVRSLTGLKLLGNCVVPIVSWLPFSMLYPTGEKQNKRTPKWEKYFKWADVIAGDFHYLYRYMPDDMEGKIVVTNTTTARNIEDMKALGISTVITTTPEFEGRSFGTNVMEGVYSTILGKKKGDPPTVEEFRSLLKKMGLKPRIVELNK